jgi:hypothetical protein
MTDAERRIIDGTAWDEFCDALKEAGKVVQSEKAPTDAFNRAEGYRYLTRMLRAGLESFVEHGNPAFPELRCPCHTTIKMGADNPDNYYQSTSISPAFDYRITGTRGTVDYLGFGTVINKYSTGGGMKTDGYLDSREMKLESDGRLEIIVSQKEQPGNWLPMGPETNSLNVRQTFQDRQVEKPAEIRIERIGAEAERPEPLTAEKLDRALKGAVMFIRGTTQLFENWAESFVPTCNELPPADQGYGQSIGGDPNIFYFHSAWELADDEVLVLEADEIPECQTWNFQLDNWWMESLDYRYHTIHKNKHTAEYESDGGVKLVISHTDPGHPNWIETAGHRSGTMCWRWIGASESPPVKSRVMKLADLR